ncbi:integrase catalytic domain-containing protein [Trichonephila clavipes]|uniref:Integrase catalytic domain-containing protein n=1 Tax=Trichonephila clavipes TaxID=2585209 RepID=A0A8X6WJB6_TRICX|nr:integrase catalytic domain-containing protein [Trichonephila clavipes]
MSDNATNFKGAAAELNRFIKLICNKNETLANYFASKAIQWKFIPPRSPNFGGLWEAGVKSFKHHLYRTLVNSKITFEEFETVIIQIEGILNSRPLVPLSDNINEYEVLTPGHFIIGRPISAIPEPAILDISDNKLSRAEKQVAVRENNVAVGCLVLLKENDLPPCKWTMARILEVIYGTDERLEDNYYEFSVLEEFVEDVEYENFTNSKDLADLALEKIDSYLTSINSKLQFEENKSKVNAYSNINLPKYDLPQFAGDFNSWLSFKSIFSSSIDSNESLTDIQKLQYLQNAVTSDASRLIKGFAITHENYKQAWETLLNRYDNQRELAFPQCKRFFSLRKTHFRINLGHDRRL